MGTAPLERVAVSVLDLPCARAASRFQSALGVKRPGIVAVLLAMGASLLASDPKVDGDRPTVIVAVGAEGEEQYGTLFQQSAASWKKAAETAGANITIVGTSEAEGGTNDLNELRARLQKERKDAAAELWLVLLGHGTFDGKEARFNLRGPDLTAAELARWLQGFSRPIAVIHGGSSSAPFINALSATNRVIVTATKSGAEENYARFGNYISDAIADPAADLDKDGQTSLLEAFLMASRRVAEFYKSEGRLATEHALVDDNGDGLGTSADWFRGTRVVKAPARGGAVDGVRAHQWHLIRSSADQKLTVEQRRRRDDLELQITRLRQQKGALAEDEYYRRLEELLTKLSPFVLDQEESR